MSKPLRTIDGEVVSRSNYAALQQNAGYGFREAKVDARGMTNEVTDGLLSDYASPRQRASALRLSDRLTRFLDETEAHIATLEAAHREPVSDDAVREAVDALCRSFMGYRRCTNSMSCASCDDIGQTVCPDVANVITITTALTAAQSERDAEAGKVARLEAALIAEKRGRWLDGIKYDSCLWMPQAAHFVEWGYAADDAPTCEHWGDCNRRSMCVASFEVRQACLDRAADHYIAALAPQPTGDSDE